MAWGRGAGGEGATQSPSPLPLSPAHDDLARDGGIAGRGRGESRRRPLSEGAAGGPRVARPCDPFAIDWDETMKRPRLSVLGTAILLASCGAMSLAQQPFTPIAGDVN